MSEQYIDLETARRAREKASRRKKAPTRDPNDERPVIRLTAGTLEKTVDQAERALITANVDLFQRAGIIVGVGSTPMMTSHKKEVSAVTICEVGEHRLLELMMSAAAFEKWDARADDYVPANCPLTIPKTLRERKGHLRFPVIAGVINGPTMRPDGSILAKPGYDEETGLFVDLGRERFPIISDKPTQRDANAALKVLEELIVGFPFVGQADQAVALAAMLTAIVRRPLPTAPAFAFSAPTAGSGKSMMVDLCSVLATGREAGVIAPGRNDEETEKRLASLLLAGAPIAIDNAEHGVGGELLCQILTQRTVRLRVLGKSDTPELPTNTLVSITGNNLTLVGDMTRRALLCRLDAKEERPELRKFDFDPVERAKAQRPTFMAAALTVLRAFHVAGRPQQVTRLGSFGEWSDLVRGALLWLGTADPVETFEQTRAADPRIEHLRAIMVQWNKVVGGEKVSANDVAQRASERAGANFGDQKGAFHNPEFREALLNVAGQGGFIDAGKLGTFLGRNKGRVIGGMHFEPAGLIEGIKKWSLVKDRAGGDDTHF